LATLDQDGEAELLTLKGFLCVSEPFQGLEVIQELLCPRVASAQPWAGIGDTFGVGFFTAVSYGCGSATLSISVISVVRNAAQDSTTEVPRPLEVAQRN